MKATTICRIFVVAALGCVFSSSQAEGILQPGDTIYAIDRDLGTPPNWGAGHPNEAVDKVIDGDGGTKYLSNGNNWSGFIVTPGASLVRSIRFTTANDAQGRDPASYVLYGTYYDIYSTAEGPGFGEPWTMISSGSLSLPAARGDSSTVVSFANNTSYTSYKLLFPSLQNNQNLMQIAETQFYSEAAGAGLSVLSPGNAIIPVDRTGMDGSSRNPTPEGPARILDGNTATKYLNFGEVNSGFIVTPQYGPSVVGGFQLWTANDSPERDPAGYALYGMNGAVDPLVINSTGDGAWTLLSEGSLTLPTDRFAAGGAVFFPNNQSYTSYRFIVTSVRDETAANSMQFSDFELYLVPEPSALGLFALGGVMVAGAIRRQRR